MMDEAELKCEGWGFERYLESSTPGSDGYDSSIPHSRTAPQIQLAQIRTPSTNGCIPPSMRNPNVRIWDIEEVWGGGG